MIVKLNQLIQRFWLIGSLVIITILPTKILDRLPGFVRFLGRKSGLDGCSNLTDIFTILNESENYVLKKEKSGTENGESNKR